MGRVITFSCIIFTGTRLMSFLLKSKVVCNRLQRDIITLVIVSLASEQSIHTSIKEIKRKKYGSTILF